MNASHGGGTRTEQTRKSLSEWGLPGNSNKVEIPLLRNSMGKNYNVAFAFLADLMPHASVNLCGACHSSLTQERGCQSSAKNYGHSLRRVYD